jgi:signal peptidase I
MRAATQRRLRNAGIGVLRVLVPLSLAALFVLAFPRSDALAVQLGAFVFVLWSLVVRYWTDRLWPRTDARAVAPKARKRESVLLIATVLLAAGLAFVVRGSAIETQLVGSASMLPSLFAGDRIAVDKRAYGVKLPGSTRRFASHAPERGDVIVFRSPLETGAPTLVKRVIGLPGDKIEMMRGHPIINGWNVPSCDVGPYVYFSAERSLRGRIELEFLDGARYLTLHTTGQRAFEEYVVKPGEVFVLGDDRNNSIDSRVFGGERGAGVVFESIEGRGSFFVYGNRRDGGADFGLLFESLRSHSLRIDGADARALHAGIERCLAKPPATTTPPNPGVAWQARGVEET